MKFFNEVMSWFKPEFRRFLHQWIVVALSPHTKYALSFERCDIVPTDPDLNPDMASVRQWGGMFPKLVLPSPFFDNMVFLVIPPYLFWRFPSIGIFDGAAVCFAGWRLKNFVQQFKIRFCIAYDSVGDGVLKKPIYGKVLAADSDEVLLERSDGSFVRTSPISVHSIISREEYETSMIVES